MEAVEVDDKGVELKMEAKQNRGNHKWMRRRMWMC